MNQSAHLDTKSHLHRALFLLSTTCHLSARNGISGHKITTRVKVFPIFSAICVYWSCFLEIYIWGPCFLLKVLGPILHSCLLLLLSSSSWFHFFEISWNIYQLGKVGEIVFKHDNSPVYFWLQVGLMHFCLFFCCYCFLAVLQFGACKFSSDIFSMFILFETWVSESWRYINSNLQGLFFPI